MEHPHCSYPQLLTVEQLQNALQVSRTTAYQLIHNRTIPSVKIGRSVRVRLSDVEDYIEANSRG